MDLAVRFELVGTADPEPVPSPVGPVASGPRERRCSAVGGEQSFAPLYHFTFRSDEALAANEKRFREFLKQLPPRDEATSTPPAVATSTDCTSPGEWTEDETGPWDLTSEAE